MTPENSLSGPLRWFFYSLYKGFPNSQARKTAFLVSTGALRYSSLQICFLVSVDDACARRRTEALQTVLVQRFDGCGP